MDEFDRGTPKTTSNGLDNRGTKTEKVEPKIDGTIIPDKSLISSVIGVVGQHIVILYNELKDYFDWVEENKSESRGLDFIVRAASFTENTLVNGTEEWISVVNEAEDIDYTLGRCIREKKNSCFQRSVFFHLLMQQRGYDAKLLQGVWVDSTRSDLKIKPPASDLLSMSPVNGELLYTALSDNNDGHLWNIVLAEGEFYLVDTAYLIGDGENARPVVKIIDYKPGDQYFTVPYPDGGYRHYVVQGDPEIQDISDLIQG